MVEDRDDRSIPRGDLVDLDGNDNNDTERMKWQ